VASEVPATEGAGGQFAHSLRTVTESHDQTEIDRPRSHRRDKRKEYQSDAFVLRSG